MELLQDGVIESSEGGREREEGGREEERETAVGLGILYGRKVYECPLFKRV